MTLQRSYRDMLGEEWVIESIKTQKVEVAFTPGSAGQQSIQQIVIPRFTVRDRTLAVAISEESLTIETTAYRHYPDFRAVLRGCIRRRRSVPTPRRCSAHRNAIHR